LGKTLFDVQAEESLTFTIVVHGATVLSTIVVFYKDLLKIGAGLLKFSWNQETIFTVKILFSMIPVLIVGLFFKEETEMFFSGNVGFVGGMLLIRALLLFLTHFAKSGNKRIPFSDAFIIGIAQALAVIPGISRSGATIASGLLLKNQKEEVTRFSFLMVLIPILGVNFIDILGGSFNNETGVGVPALIIGFIAAFISGTLACKWMIGIVRKGKLIYFAIYCLIIGGIAIFVSLQ